MNPCIYFISGLGSRWIMTVSICVQGMPSGVYDNIYDSLDDSPVSWHITEPVDPTAYQSEYLGNVIGIY